MKAESLICCAAGARARCKRQAMLCATLLMGLLVWAYLPARKQAFDEAAAMPLKDEESGS